jgi:hypothetical protein
MPRITLIVTTALTAFVLSGAVATAMPLRGDVGTAVAPKQDLRGADARHAALAHERYYGSYRADTNAPASRIAARQDLRSPDTRDIAAGRKYPPVPTVVTLEPVKAPEPRPAAGFDWVAGIAGAGAALGVILLAAGAAVLVTRRRAHRDQPVAA